MEDEDVRVLRLAKPSAEDILLDLTGQQLEGIKGSVRAGIDSIESGEYTEYQDRIGLKSLADEVKSRGRVAWLGKSRAGETISYLERRKIGLG
jgi:hypothetical protein